MELNKPALSFVIYVRQFEDLCIQVLNAYVEKIHRFTPEQREKLVKVFRRVQLIVPQSPFLVWI
jgi:hypothetical protein